MNRLSDGASNRLPPASSSVTNTSRTNDDQGATASTASGTGYSGSGGSHWDDFEASACREVVPLVCSVVCTLGTVIATIVGLVIAQTSPSNATASPAAAPDAVAAMTLGAALAALGLL